MTQSRSFYFQLVFSISFSFFLTFYSLLSWAAGDLWTSDLKVSTQASKRIRYFPVEFTMEEPALSYWTPFFFLSPHLLYVFSLLRVLAIYPTTLILSRYFLSLDLPICWCRCRRRCSQSWSGQLRQSDGGRRGRPCAMKVWSVISMSPWPVFSFLMRHAGLVVIVSFLYGLWNIRYVCFVLCLCLYLYLYLYVVLCTYIHTIGSNQLQLQAIKGMEERRERKEKETRIG